MTSPFEAAFEMPPIDPSIEKFPYCIVWTPIPCITWILPFIGHTGIGDSNGVIHDFAGPYHIGIGSLAFGRATRYLQLTPENCSAFDWDTGVKEGCEVYKGRNHNLIFDNCHSHVAKCLNVMAYDRKSNHDMIKIGVWMFFCGKFVSPWAFVQTYLPFTILVFLFALFCGLFT